MENKPIAELSYSTSSIGPVIVGKYVFNGGDIIINLTKKPKLIHRWCVRLLFGGVWKDNK